MRRYILLGLVLVAVTVAGCTSNQTPENPEPAINASEDNVVIYNQSGFFPQTITIQKGETVTWKSQGPRMWVASDVHPTHTEYAGTRLSQHCGNAETADERFDACKMTQTYSFTFNKTGTWGYHNHVLSQHTGTVIVK
ncbi:MAG: hypothetical protein SV186_04420 [Candidatus Nanohaloarchaea archaeon]|nr:hypothetical protein [Candidatus Nanohaloarchaea archaeon]